MRKARGQSIRQKKMIESFRETREGNKRGKKEREGRRGKSQSRRKLKKVGLKENLQFSFGSSDSSSACEQFSLGDDSCLLNTSSWEPWLAFGALRADLPSSQELP